MIVMQKKWFVVYTRINSEKKVISFLNKAGIEHYFPLNRLFAEDLNENIKIIEVPLFTSYVFVNITDKDFSTIKECNDIINFVFFLGRPIIIDEIEIDFLRKFVSDSFNIRIEKTTVRLNNASRIMSKVSDYYGYDKPDVTKKNKNSIIIPSLGYKLVADLTDNEIGKKYLSQKKRKSSFN